MGAAEIVAARADLADGVERLRGLRKVDALSELLLHAELVLVDHELLVGGDEAAFEPAGRVQHEIRAGKQRHVQRVGRFMGGLRIRDLRAAQRAAGTERQAETAGELRRAVGDERGFGRAEGRRARLHGDRGGEGAEQHRRTLADELGEGGAGENLGEDLRQRAGDGDRAHGARQDER